MVRVIISALILCFISTFSTGCLTAKKKASFCDVVKADTPYKGQCFYSAKNIKQGSYKKLY